MFSTVLSDLRGKPHLMLTTILLGRYYEYIQITGKKTEAYKS